MLRPYYPHMDQEHDGLLPLPMCLGKIPTSVPFAAIPIVHLAFWVTDMVMLPLWVLILGCLRKAFCLAAARTLRSMEPFGTESFLQDRNVGAMSCNGVATVRSQEPEGLNGP